MKNALLIVNIVLVIAVATLFFLYFSRKAPQLSAAAVTSGATENPAEFRIAYFEMDSLENNYTYFKEMRELFRSREQKLNGDLEAI
ncbi:MAG TPA: hypothetical protein VF145_12280, partial [Chitinophagaceae bacterium]